MAVIREKRDYVPDAFERWQRVARGLLRKYGRHFDGCPASDEDWSRVICRPDTAAPAALCRSHNRRRQNAQMTHCERLLVN